MLVWLESRRDINIRTSEEDLQERHPEIAIERARGPSGPESQEFIVVPLDVSIEREKHRNEEARVDQVVEQRTRRRRQRGRYMGQAASAGGGSGHEIGGASFVGEQAMKLIGQGCHGESEKSVLLIGSVMEVPSDHGQS